jgi:hypothetical protein
MELNNNNDRPIFCYDVPLQKVSQCYPFPSMCYLSNSRSFICRIIRRIPQKNAALIGLTSPAEGEMAHFHGGRVLCSDIVP